MEKKLTYITYQTFPAKTANSIQTISTIKHLTRAGLDTTLIYPLRNQESSDDLLQLKNHYKFEDNIKLIGTIHPLPFKKINFFEKYWYLISHFLWSYFTVRKFYSSKQEFYFTRSEWVFYFLSKKNANVMYECHQISKLKKILVNSALRNKSSRVLALTDNIRNALEKNEDDRIKTLGSAFDEDYFFSNTEKKNHIVYAGSLYRFGQSRGIEILFESSLNLEIEDLKLIIISSDEDEIQSFKQAIKNTNLNFDLQIYEKLNQRQVGEILSSAKVGLLINNTSQHANLYSSPLKYFEYLASGLNVVATDLLSHRNLPFSNNINFYTANDFNSLQSAILNAFKENENVTLSIDNFSMGKRISKIIDFF